MRTSGTPTASEQCASAHCRSAQDDVAMTLPAGRRSMVSGHLRSLEAAGKGCGRRGHQLWARGARCAPQEHVATVLLAGRRFIASARFGGVESAGKGSKWRGHQPWARGARRAPQECAGARRRGLARRTAISCVGPSTDRTSSLATFCYSPNASPTRPDPRGASSGRRTGCTTLAFQFSLLDTRAPIIKTIGSARRQQRKCSISL